MNKYTDWPRTFNQNELEIDAEMQRLLGINKWGPQVKGEYVRVYSLPSGKRVVLHQDMNDSGDTIHRVVVAGEPVRPLRYLGLLSKIRYLSEGEKHQTERELGAIFNELGKKVDSIDFWFSY